MDELQKILTQRLPHIKRWKKVIVCDWSNSPKWVKDVYAENDNMVYIIWNGNKAPTNHHNHEIKEFPKVELPKIITRNKERLLNERPIYK